MAATLLIEKSWPHEFCDGWHWLTLPLFMGIGLLLMRLASGVIGRGAGCLLALVGIVLTMLWLDDGGMFCAVGDR